MRAIAPRRLRGEGHIGSASAVGTVCIDERCTQPGGEVRAGEVLDCTLRFAMVEAEPNAHACIPGELLEAEQRTGVGEADERRGIRLQRREQMVEPQARYVTRE